MSRCNIWLFLVVVFWAGSSHGWYNQYQYPVEYVVREYSYYYPYPYQAYEPREYEPDTTSTWPYFYQPTYDKQPYEIIQNVSPVLESERYPAEINATKEDGVKETTTAKNVISTIATSTKTPTTTKKSTKPTPVFEDLFADTFIESGKVAGNAQAIKSSAQISANKKVDKQPLGLKNDDELLFTKTISSSDEVNGESLIPTPELKREDEEKSLSSGVTWEHPSEDSKITSGDAADTIE